MLFSKKVSNISFWHSLLESNLAFIVCELSSIISAIIPGKFSS